MNKPIRMDKTAQMMVILQKHYPEFAYSYMDGAYYWKSLEEYQAGDIIEYQGNTYRVRYSWAWWPVLPGVATVYMAEMDLVGEFTKNNETSGPYDPF